MKKKIMFFCGCLEPGADGVGDYTRRLAGALIEDGFTVQLVSINDNYIKIPVNEHQYASDKKISVLRMPNCYKWSEKTDTISNFIEKFDPEWLSLQYVPFSYHPKGLPFSLSGKLKKLGRVRKWHVMFHELWVGMDINSSYKLKWWGKVQYHIIKRMIKDLRPSLMHTQTQLYQYYLTKMGMDVKRLPLFGNIPITQLKQKDDYTSSIRIVVFGNIHSNTKLLPFARMIAKLQDKEEASFEVHFVGKNGSNLTEWVDVFSQYGIANLVHGVRNQVEISTLLQQCDIGLSTTPLVLDEKSGSVAAMEEHGLFIINVANKWTPSGYRGKEQAVDDEFDFSRLALATMKRDITKVLQTKLKMSTEMFTKSLIEIWPA
ncbi:hypothetical protein [Pedobacter frigiditerrae]|uniref:hypothetical protein n=1 Tax=Pedobacter frigiditerrae TaxID=2530452 RepID=UPI002931282E|nr:hypothetical protein [Pedobacter frigiditerrae]